MTTLLCTITEKGNAVAILEGQPTERFLVTKSGEFKHDAALQFPDYILTDKMTGEATAEILLRDYLNQKVAEKIEAERIKNEAEEKAAINLKARCGSFVAAIHILNDYQVRRYYIEPTTKSLRAALKKAEAQEAKAKEIEAWKKICVKACAPLAKKAPKSPLKGASYAREDFPTIGNNAKMQAIFAAIPSRHKNEISSRRQKGYFSWSPVVSPEAMEKVSHLITLATK